MSTVTEKQYCSPEIWGGIECTINRVNNSFLDQLEYAGLYSDIPVTAITGLGVKKIRFPVLWEKHQPEKNTVIDWSWTARQVEKLRDNNIDVIAGLVHHGSGPAYTNLLDPKFPVLLASYAKKVAERFPWIKYYTPVNEPLTTARFSGLYGLWYPHKKNEKSFFIALLNQLKGIVLSMQEIRKINPLAQLVQTEDLGKTYSTLKLQYQAKFENERRWLTYDILCGRFNKHHKLWKYYQRIGIPVSLLNFFTDNPCIPGVFGFNHYVTSERFLDENITQYPKELRGGNRKHKYVDIEAARVKLEQPHGAKVLLKEAWERYKQPLAVTEVHLHCHREEQIRWFKYIHEAACSLNEEGIPVKAITAWAMFGSYGWNKLLTVPAGEYEPGVYDMRGGYPRATALTSYIKSITHQKPFIHTYFTERSGWWQRSSRFLQQPSVEKMEMHPSMKNFTRPVLIIGKTGTLGNAFSRICDHRAIPYKVMSRQDCDIAVERTVEAAIDFYKPWAVINAAGYVRVDDAESDYERCYRENHTGAAILAKVCNEKGVKLVSFSSDLVFDGAKNTPYVESDKTNPLNVYGRSKAESEKDLSLIAPSSLIIRTSAFFGPDDQYNFLHWVETNLAGNCAIRVANDILVSPTYVPDLVNTTLDLLIDDESGIWHLANNGAITWYELAKKVAAYYNYNASLIIGIPASGMNYSALRPGYSVLGTERGHILPSLENAIDRYFAEKKQFSETVNNEYVFQSSDSTAA
jgi:dTDP-4-dehydrorhamnose reductase